MSKLEEIFQIEDKKKRIDELVVYARSLKVNYLMAKKDDGTFSENELAVLIHNCEANRKTSVVFNLSFALGGLLLLALFVIAMFFMVKLLVPPGGGQ